MELVRKQRQGNTIRHYARQLGWIALALLLLILGGGYFWVRGQYNAAQHALLPLLPPLASDRVVVFAPHPDDETLGAGGYLQKAAAVGARVHVVLMTNGEYGRSMLDQLPELPAERASGYLDYGMIRQQETLMALGVLGVPQSSVTFLCYPNHLLAAMQRPANWLPENPVFNKRLNTTRITCQDALSPGAPYSGQSVLHDVETVLLREKPTVVITLNPNDIHPDHWATWAYTRNALLELAAQGYAFARTCRIYTYLIHRGNYWPEPKLYLPSLALLPPDSLAHAYVWRSLPLRRKEQRMKSAAISLYQTQDGATSSFMRSFARINDLYAPVPDKRWENTPEVKPTTVIVDPPADFPRALNYPSADILRVSLQRAKGAMIVRIITRKPATTATRFELSLMVGGATPGDRLLLEYQWQNHKATGQVLRNGALAPMPAKMLQGSVKGSRATLRVPWPLEDGRSDYFMLQAWSSEKGHSADVSAATVFRVTNNQ